MKLLIKQLLYNILAFLVAFSLLYGLGWIWPGVFTNFDIYGPGAVIAAFLFGGSLADYMTERMKRG